MQRSLDDKTTTVERKTQNRDKQQVTSLQRLKRETDVMLFGPKSNKDVRVIPVLKQRLDAAALQLHDRITFRNYDHRRTGIDKTIDVTVQFGESLRRSEACVARLTRQIELNSDCRQLIPDLMFEMALKIKRLNDIMSRKVKYASSGLRSCDTGGNSGRGEGKSGGQQKRSREGMELYCCSLLCIHLCCEAVFYL